MARSGYSPFQKFLKKIFVFFQRIYLNWLYDSVIAVNPNQNNWLISEYKINPNKIKFLPIGIDQHHFDQIDTMTVRNELFFDEKDVIGTYVGRFHSYKGVMDILKSLKILRSEFPDLKFVFMGKDAGELNKMRAYISKFNLKNTVKILITPSDEKRDQILELSDFFVFPSEWEAYGIATIEAMAHKNAIITTKTEGSLHLINDKINGLFIEYNNPESIAKAIQKILSNPKLLRKMKNNNFEKVKQITWSNIWTEYVELYNSFTV